MHDPYATFPESCIPSPTDRQTDRHDPTDTESMIDSGQVHHSGVTERGGSGLRDTGGFVEDVHLEGKKHDQLGNRINWDDPGHWAFSFFRKPVTAGGLLREE
ncbi:hypothetical protein EYF80_033893 [Liparis tanakae]|uniref:Uncharacterized protein n=1 Tax=Liparis tanakae TaxID=230148 RepID=A0A4Z2GTG7_9TELE|nr:hypothetical protein EYF80_033893 [Liparis tanakae]